MKQKLTLLLLLFSLQPSWAVSDLLTFSSKQQQQQYQDLIEGLRCPKCQNNNIADSDAMIAADMRLRIYQLLQQGQTPQQIVAYMVTRYGHFVTYQPPVTASTLILWVGPLFFIVGGFVVLFYRNKNKTLTPDLDPSQQQKIIALLKQEGKE